MSSLFSRTPSTSRRRSRSEVRSVDKARTHRDKIREPLIDFSMGDDVVTQVCIELSRATLTDPSVNTGVYFRTTTNSRKAIAISDATIVITAAILEHIGDTKRAQKLVGKSATLSSYYDKMNLQDKVVREMFVTMLFSLSPDFVRMIDKALTLAIERNASQATAEGSEDKLSNAMVSLNKQGLITDKELIAASAVGSRGLTVQKSPERRPFMIHPNRKIDSIKPMDSISQIEVEDTIVRGMPRDEKDLMDYVKHRQTLRAPRFEDVFRESRPPVAAVQRKPRQGLGYDEKADPDTFVTNSMNNLLGSKTVASYNLATGPRKDRRPRVDDFVESESIATTALAQAPDMTSDYTQNYKVVKKSKHIPTETILPDSPPETPEQNRGRPVLRPVQSLEDISDMLAAM